MSIKRSYLKKILALVVPLLFIATLVGMIAWGEGALSTWGRFFTVLESSLITLMGEYPDRPNTTTGRIAQLLLLVSGTVILGTIIGKISSLFVTHALHKEKKMKNFKDHIIICNWNDKAPCIIKQLLDTAVSKPRDVVVVSTSKLDMDEIADDFDNVTFVQADPSRHTVLEELNATKAKSVILLADPESSAPDEKNALIALAVKHLEQNPAEKLDIHVVAELVQSDLRRHLTEAGVDEVVMFKDYSSGILAQSALYHNMSVVYQRLLTYSDDTNELYFISPGKYPAEYIGKGFPQLCQCVAESNTTDDQNPTLLLGIKRATGEILLNPKPKHFDGLAEDDSLIVMAFSPIDRISA